MLAARTHAHVYEFLIPAGKKIEKRIILDPLHFQTTPVNGPGFPFHSPTLKFHSS